MFHCTVKPAAFTGFLHTVLNKNVVGQRILALGCEVFSLEGAHSSTGCDPEPPALSLNHSCFTLFPFNSLATKFTLISEDSATVIEFITE